MEKMNHLERIRREQGLSRRELELLSGVKQVTIQHLEKGITNADNVKLSTLIKLAKALHCKVIDLLNADLKRVVG